MEEKYILAIEIGSSNIKGAVGTLDADGILKVVAIEVEKHLDSVRHGLVQNVENVSKRVNLIIRKLENRVSPYKARSLYLGIGGRSFMSSPRIIDRQLPTEEDITKELIDQLRIEARNTALSDREVVDVVDSEYIIDNHNVPDPVGTVGQSIRAVFNLITCRLQAKRNLVRAIEERLNYKINGMIVRQLAEGELVLGSDMRRQGCMLVDFGAETTTVSIYKGGTLIYMSTIPLGSRNITRDIMTLGNLGNLEERAEELKIAGGHANPHSPGVQQVIEGFDFTEVNEYINARATEIATNINEQIAYAGVHNNELPGGIVLIGGGSKLKGFGSLLEKTTKMSVSVGMPSPMLRIADTHAATVDSIDVISILAAAAKSPDLVECMTRPEPVILTPEPKVETPAPQPAPQPIVEEKREEEEEPADPKSVLIDDEEDIEEVTIRPRKNFFARLKRGITDLTERIMEDGDEEDE